VAFRAGTTTAIYLGNAAGALQNVSSYADNFSWPQTVDTLETSAFGTAAKTFIPGLTDGDTISVSGPLDVTLFTQLTALKAAGSITPIIYGPGGSVASQARVAGSVFVSALNFSTSVGGRVEYTASLQVTGATASGTF
jgi:hypothetical protein